MKDCFCFRNYVCLGCEDATKPKTKRASSRPVAQCGTRAGYNRHLKNGEPTCADCKRAQVEAVQKWKAKR